MIATRPSRSLLWLSLLLACVASTVHAEQKKPNFLILSTDDQNLHMQCLDYMPLLKKHITSQGTTFEKRYCTVAIYCPSCVNI